MPVEFLVAAHLDLRDDAVSGRFQPVEKLRIGDGLVVEVELLRQATQLVPLESGVGEIDRLPGSVAVEPFQHQLVPPDEIGGQVGNAHPRVPGMAFHAAFARELRRNGAQLRQQPVEAPLNRRQQFILALRNSHGLSFLSFSWTLDWKWQARRDPDE